MVYGRHHPYYDRDGQPIDLMDWARKFEDDEYRTVGLHFVRGWGISTIWFGINTALHSPVPLIFETAILAPGDGRIGGDDDLDDYQERYPTVAAAAAGHDRALAAVLERLGPGAAADVHAGPMPAVTADGVDWDQLVSGLESGARPETSDPQD